MSVNFNYNLDTITTTSGILTQADTGGFKVASGDNVSTKPPATGNNGLIRYNTTTNRLEAVINGSYTNLTIVSDVAGQFLALSGGTMTGQILTVSGNVSSPSIAFASDAASGVYQPVTSTVAITTASAERLRIDGSGYLLINTTTNTTLSTGSTNYSSHIAKSTSQNVLTVQSTDTTNGTNLNFANANSASNLYRYAQIKALPTATTAGSESGALTFSTANVGSDANVSERMRIAANGNVYIKTTTALDGATLTVAGFISATTPTAGDSSTKVATTNFVTSAVAAANPVSTIITVAANTVPAGYLACDGSAVSRTTYANLYNTIGTTYGSGDGSTTFNLPNLLGQFIRGFDSAGSTDAGRTFGSTQASQFAQHSHTYTDNGHVHYYGVLPLNINLSGGGVYYVASPGSNNAATSPSGVGITINSAGTVTETRPTNVAMLFCIKY